MRSSGVLVLLPLAACLQISTGTGTGAGTTAGSTSPASTESGDGGTGGSGCAEDPQTQIVLCEGIDLCPGVVVDPGVYPNCGFRLHGGSALDLECLCGDELCPVGVPTTCAQAQQLLDGQSSLLVCQQEGQGSCVSLVAPDAGSASPCAACAAECGG